MAPLEAVLVGAGQRGRDVVGRYALNHPAELRLVAVADPDEGRRVRLAREHGIPPERQFRHWEDLFDHPPLAPICFIATLDRDHLASAVRALECGHDLFLEKPMADTAGGCLRIASTAARVGRGVQICHPLRYTPFYGKLHELISAGAVGKILSLSMSENIAHWHFAHSFVRGNWGVVERSGPLILTKCCHDMDIATWLAGRRIRRVSSFGGLTHYTAANAPEGAPERCTDGCPAEPSCPHSALAVYLQPDYVDWPVSVISLDMSLEARRRALETGPYGRCVFRCDNTAADHQVVVAEFESGLTFDFTVRADTHEACRTLRITGTAGEIRGHFERGEIAVQRFRSGLWPKSDPEIFRPVPLEGAHGGGDTGVLQHFLGAMRRGDRAALARSLEIAVEGHLLAFAAEEARVSGAVVAMEEFRRRLGDP